MVPSIKAATVNDGKVLQGYACVYNKAALLADDRAALIRPGAFDQTLSEGRRVEFWLDHLSTMSIGSTDSELELATDQKGLGFRFRFPDTALGELARTNAEMGYYSGMSVGCKFTDYKVKKMEGFKVWIIKEADLEEISFSARLSRPSVSWSNQATA